MKKCPRCKAEYRNNYEFCSKCGVRLLPDADARLAGLEDQAKRMLAEIEQIRIKAGIKREDVILPAAPQAQPQAQAKAQAQPVAAPAAEAQHEPPAPVADEPARESTETVIGKYILNKIGVISVVAGVSFLVACTFAAMLPAFKIGIGYIVSAAMIRFGIKRENNEKFKKYAMAVIGGGWALAYFTTFAMHYIPATRVVTSQLADLLLLVVVVTLMTLHMYKYKSQALVQMTMFLGYVTAIISGATYFTLIYTTLLAISSVYLAYKVKWERLGILSMLGTYLAHLIWMRPHLYLYGQTQKLSAEFFWPGIGFLVIYAAVYNLLAFILKTENKNDIYSARAFAFLNALLFGVLGMLQIFIYRPEWRFGFGICAALASVLMAMAAMRLARKEYLVSIFVVIAAAFVTFSLRFKISNEIVDAIWLAEIPVFIYIGSRSKDLIYRVSGMALTVLAFFKMLSYSVPAHLNFYTNDITGVYFPQAALSPRLVVWLIGAAAFFAMKFIYNARPAEEYADKEKDIVPNIYMFGATLLLLAASAFDVQADKVTVIWAAVILALFAAGFMLRDKFFRYAALCVTACAAVRVVMYDMSGLDPFSRILAFIFFGAVLMAASYIYTKMSGMLAGKGELKSGHATGATIFALAALILLILSSAVLRPSELRLEEIASMKEVAAAKSFIQGEALSDEDKAFLIRRDRTYFALLLQKVYFADKGKGYELYIRAVKGGLATSRMYTELAELYESRNEPGMAVEFYKKAMDVKPATAGHLAAPDHKRKVAELYYKIGDYNNASLYYQKVIGESRYGADYEKYMLADCYARAGKYDDALSVLNSAVRESPGSRHLADMYRVYGFVYEKKSMLKEAEENYARSLHIRSENEEAAEGLKRVITALKDKGKRL